MMRELKKHPDLGGSTAEAALINEAHETLTDPNRRAAYDDELFLQAIQPPYPQAKKPAALTSCPVCNCPLSQAPAPDALCPTCRTPLPSTRQPAAAMPKGRSIERTKISAPVSYLSSWPGKAQEGRMIDFSPKGVRFIASESLTVGSVLKISCSLFEASGRITNVSEEISNKQKCYSTGVCFIAVRFEDPRGTFFSTKA